MCSIALNSAFDTVTKNKAVANDLQIRADLIIVMRDVGEGYNGNTIKEKSFIQDYLQMRLSPHL